MNEPTQQQVDRAVAGLDAQVVVGYPIATLTATYFFYGLYTILVILCVWLLMRDRFDNRRFYLLSTLVLFIICTMMVIDVTIFRTLEACLEFEFVKTKDLRPVIHFMMYNKPMLVVYAAWFAIPPLANIVAETMLIHRCYIIWGRSKRVAIPLIILSAIGSLFFFGASVAIVVGDVNISSQTGWKLRSYAELLTIVGSALSAAVNVLVTLLTAGRIWQVNRLSRAHYGVSEKRDKRKLPTAARIILESGIIYPTVMVVQLTTSLGYHGRVQFLDLNPVVVLSAGIAPTLALLRAQMTKLSERTSSKVRFERVSDVRFDSARLARLGGTSTGNYTISLDIRPSNAGEVLRPPEPLVHPRQSVGLLSSPTRETHDIEKGQL
ncbi:hypothetical protein PQX77_005283 [Marasmius sp. AFHP31]|nr:hypothetical protein PQX77_005283 [Marasmius sp. AFHP31]